MQQPKTPYHFLDKLEMTTARSHFELVEKVGKPCLRLIAAMIGNKRNLSYTRKLGI